MLTLRLNFLFTILDFREKEVSPPAIEKSLFVAGVGSTRRNRQLLSLSIIALIYLKTRIFHQSVLLPAKCMTLDIPDLLCRSHFLDLSVLFAFLWTFSKHLGQHCNLHILCLCPRINGFQFQGYLIIYRERSFFFLYSCKTTGMRFNKDLIHTSKDWASSSSQCSEFVPPGVLLLNLHNNGKLNPFLKEAEKNPKRISPFWLLMNHISWDLFTILTRSALAACVACSPVAYFFLPAESKTYVRPRYGVSLSCRISIGYTCFPLTQSKNKLSPVPLLLRNTPQWLTSVLWCLAPSAEIVEKTTFKVHNLTTSTLKCICNTYSYDAL